MADFTSGDEALGALVLIEELLTALNKAGVMPEAMLADVIRSASARLDTSDQFGPAAAVRHYFEHWLRD
jgi:hypothetical protein